MRGSDRCAYSNCGTTRFIPARAGIGTAASESCTKSAVHPRSCGDRNAQRRHIAGIVGSSPLVRGSVTVTPWQRLKCRFIPARAGIGSSVAPAALPIAVHPRSCGDRHGAMHARLWPHGSSPLVRGSGPLGKHIPSLSRFIPARAGIGASGHPGTACRSVHPRSCGDRCRPSRSCVRTGGSSPLVRGSGADGAVACVGVRFIPARAGIGRPCHLPAWWLPVHPRSCGDRDVRYDAAINSDGSSPLVRGSALAADWLPGMRRFIPARAGIGQTPAQSGRSCRGSSPLVRGSDAVPGTCLAAIRFIPARAGIGSTLARLITRSPVHPRSCGDRATPPTTAEPLPGSSPLVRGSGLIF